MAAATNDDILDALKRLIELEDEALRGSRIGNGNLTNTNGGNKIYSNHGSGIGGGFDVNLKNSFSNLNEIISENVKEFENISKRSQEIEDEFKELLKNADKINTDGYILSEEEAKYVEQRKREIHILKEIEEEDINLRKEELENEEEMLKNALLNKKNETLAIKVNEETRRHQATLNNIELEYKRKHLDKIRRLNETEEKFYERRIKWENGPLMKSKRGGKTSATELLAKWLNKKEEWEKDSAGRNTGKIVNGAVGAVNGVVNMVSSGKMDVGAMAGKIAGSLSNLGPWGAAAGGILQLFSRIFEMISKVNTAASKFAREVGGSKETMEAMENSAAKTADRLSSGDGLFGFTWGERVYDAAELMDRLREYSSEVGRNTEHFSESSQAALQDLKDFGIDTKTISSFDTFGVSVTNVSKRVKGIYDQASKQGVNAKAAIGNVTNSLKMAQNYTFSGGVRALDRMALRAAELKFNMQAAEQFANKVSTLEGAMQAGAQLSVLGGQFAMQGNPLSLLYGGLNDMESLQESMLNMTADMAKWDASKRQLDITAYNRQRLKAMSDATGIDYSDLTSQALNQARENRIKGQLNGLGFSRDEEKYITNLAELDENGNAQITLHDNDYNAYTKSISELTEKDKKKLKEEYDNKSKTTEENIGDLLGSTMSIQEKLDAILQQIKNKIVALLYKLVGGNDEERAMNQGVDKRNAPFWEDMSDDFANWGGLGKKGKERLRELGASEDFIERAGDNDNMSQDEFENELTRLVVNKQNEGYFFDPEKRKFRTSYIYYDMNNSIDDTWSYDESLDVSKKEKGGEKKANGGIIRGNGGPREDNIPIMASSGEYIMPAPQANRYGTELESMRQNRFADGGGVAWSTYSSSFGGGKTGGASNASVNGSIKIEFGTLTLRMGDATRTISETEMGNKLLADNNFVNSIIKRIGEQQNFGYRKDDAQNKWSQTLY